MRLQKGSQKGNTSTDVEKTRVSVSGDICHEKHLHGRGEDRVGRVKDQCILRNTSTDVEKTTLISPACTIMRKHLHGRGEDCHQWMFLWPL